ncbi:MAG: BamA/TamA family outer membrane protein [Muribaculaceae bacterium]|nr:BamA/TamA family outer membrane protein [Muribaculaceae bacterium]
MRVTFLTILLTAAIACTPVRAHASQAPDTASVQTARPGLIRRIIDYFSESNEPKTDKKFDISFIGGPHYSSDSKFGIGLMGAGLYRTYEADSLTPFSQSSIYADATTAGHFKIGIVGTHIFPGDKSRITYDVNFSRIATSFWGIGYEECRHDANESKYKYLNSQIRADYRVRFGKHFYAGPLAAFDYIHGSSFGNPELWHGEAARTFNFGLGVLLEYDSRDNLSAPFRGTFVRLEQQFNPRFLGNKYAFSGTKLHASQYCPLWTGATLAASFDCRLTYGNTPWGLLSTFGGSSNMRGYFEGRYRDKSAMTACVELRQHIWRRNGLAIWGGAGTVFAEFNDIRARSILPNYGIGYRWEFKQRVNVRVDLGFGRGCTGFIFSINEAF